MNYDDFMGNQDVNSNFCDDCEPEPDFEECEDVKKHKKRIEVEEVLGIGCAETNVEVCIPLCPPAFEVLDDLIRKKIVFDALVASNGKVFVNGRVIKNVPFKTKAKTLATSCRTISKITFGDIRHVTVEIPFSLCIDVPESFKGAKVVVLESDVDSVEIPNFISDRCRIIKSITEKDCIFVKVKVVKDNIICV